MEPRRIGRFLFWLMVTQAPLPVSADNWSALERYQQTITRAQFDKLVSHVYSPTGALTNYLAFTSNSLAVYSTPAKTNSPLFRLHFCEISFPSPRIPKSLRGMRVALDPGHIGGEWARMEERFFVRNGGHPVQEAALNLTVARLLKQRLEAAGVLVSLTKNDYQPVTDKRPEDFRTQAESEITGIPDDATRADAVRKRQEQLFYRSAEIAARARRINDQLKPDLTICIHFNAVEWNQCHDLVDDNRLVVFVHGNYLDNELVDDGQKFRLFAKLLERSYAVELSVAEALASSLARATKLPPVEYGLNGGAVRVGTNAYVFARNLAANRLVNGPVVYLEPYYMNNRTVYERIQLGDYEGMREIDGRSYKSIFREYADAVADGLRAACGR